MSIIGGSGSTVQDEEISGEKVITGKGSGLFGRKFAQNPIRIRQAKKKMIVTIENRLHVQVFRLKKAQIGVIIAGGRVIRKILKYWR